MQDIFLFVSFLSAFFAIINGIRRYNILNQSYRLLLLYIICILISELSAFIINLYNHKNNILWFNCYQVIDLILVGVIGIKNISREVSRYIFILSILCCLIVSIYSFNFIVFINWAFILECITISLLYLYIFGHAFYTNSNIQSYPIFWLSFGMILYYGCSIPLFSFINYLNNETPNLTRKVYMINDFLNIIRYTCFSMAFILFKIDRNV